MGDAVRSVYFADRLTTRTLVLGPDGMFLSLLLSFEAGFPAYPSTTSNAKSSPRAYLDCFTP